MSTDFEMSIVGELNFFIGLQIKQGQDDIFIKQSKYVEELLKKYKLDDVKHASIPMALNIKLNFDPNDKAVSKKVYRGMIDSILYLTASRLDIMFSVCLCANFQSAHKE